MELVTRLNWLGIAVALGGVAMIVFGAAHGAEHSAPARLAGDLLMIVSAWLYGAYMAITGLYETMRPDDPVVRNVVRYTPGALLRNVSLAGVYHVRDTQPALWAAEVESGYTAHLRFTRDPAVLSAFAGFYCRPGKTARAIASSVQPAMRSDATAAVINRLVVPRLGGAKRRDTAKHLFENLYDFESIARVIEMFGVTVYFAFSHIITTPEVWWTLAEAYPPCSAPHASRVVASCSPGPSQRSV